MTAAFSLAMDALEDAHARYLRACRQHVADLLAMGWTPAEVEPCLGPLDLIEAEQDEMVRRLWEMAA